ncbi:MAG: SDR family NAD(P)-dependent oxidoreductase [Clostridia bacterium]|nr:SDR family NAD(P)-dependent oxidoreductase [Clostridia bacterium]
MNKVALVTGAGSGIGAAAAALLAQNGWSVWGLSRRGLAPDGVKPISADVTDEKSLSGALELIADSDGRLDLLVNCAGSGISGAVEFTAPDLARSQLEVNLFGTANLCRLALPLLRETRGMILNVSSVAGVLPIPFQTWYSASKAALNSFSAALANEVRPFGVRVCAVMPGDVKTGFTAARQKNPEGDNAYSGRISRSVSKMEADEQKGMSPGVIAKKILRLSRKKRLPPRVTVGFGYTALVVLADILPSAAVNLILYGLYAK